MKANRLTQNPIIHAGLDERIGTNINGPSLIRVPSWFKQPLGRYYLYFAHHKGRFIRLAYADDVNGPWHIHQPGVLDVSESLFPAEDPPEPPVEQRPSWATTLPGGYLYAHVASPDVHIDESKQVIRMYYHGLLENGDQQTRIAHSEDGLRFTPREPLLGPPYFRAFEYDGWIYAISWQGRFLRSRCWEGPFEVQSDPGPAMQLFGSKSTLELRHPAVVLRADKLHLFFSCLGDRPERIYYAQAVIGPDWNAWQFSTPMVLLSPEKEWEGAQLPVATSIVGAADGPLHQLRDPGIFIDDNEAYLLYSGAGESNIGIARLEGL
ncbi:MAG: hypothetical protein ACO3RT_00160 [Arenicellales bacterium]|nr:hypothetical protein [Gammaproteobacteria bacterium]NDA14729.1 hypothetical protein [Gammaproteobacteria bacterium]NDG44170.1 hypothetical protein [Gammaproteobacteria bacterium]